MDQIHLDPQNKLLPHPPPLGHIVNKTPSTSTRRTKKCLCPPPPEDNFWNSPNNIAMFVVCNCIFFFRELGLHVMVSRLNFTDKHIKWVGFTCDGVSPLGHGRGLIVFITDESFCGTVVPLGFRTWRHVQKYVRGYWLCLSKTVKQRFLFFLWQIHMYVLKK